MSLALAEITTFSAPCGAHVTVVPSRVPVCSTTSPGKVSAILISKLLSSAAGIGCADALDPLLVWLACDMSMTPETTK